MNRPLKPYQAQIKLGLIFLIFILPVAIVRECKAQSPAPDLIISSETGLVTYELVIQAEGVPAEKLFEKAKAWAVETFKSPDMKDASPSLITTVFNINVNIGLGMTNPFYHDVKIKVRDGAVKLIIDNIYNDVGHDSAEKLFVKDGVITGKQQKKWVTQINDNCVGLGQSLRKKIESKEDW